MSEQPVHPLGRRVQKIAGAVTRKVTYDGEDIRREKVVGVPGVGNLRYIHGPGIDEPLGFENITTAAMTYYHADGLGSIVRTTDSTGAVTSTRTYDSFGRPSEKGADQPGYSYTGREWDPETELYYYRARYYDPKVGRFISEDPIRFGGGVNFFPYVQNRPTVFVDPSGLESGDIWRDMRVDRAKSGFNAPGGDNGYQKKVWDCTRRGRNVLNPLLLPLTTATWGAMGRFGAMSAFGAGRHFAAGTWVGACGTVWSASTSATCFFQCELDPATMPESYPTSPF